MHALDDGIHSLLADARLVVHHAIRAGQLLGNELPDAIETLSSSTSITGQDVTRFQRALNDAVAAIAPMTLVDLRAGHSPFDPRNVAGRKRWQVGLSMATVVLIASIAYYQYSVQRVADSLAAFHEVQEARLTEKVTAARQFAQYREALKQGSCAYNDYQRARHDLRKLEVRATAADFDITELAQSSPWPFGDLVNRLFVERKGPLAAKPPAMVAAAASDNGATQGAAGPGAAHGGPQADAAAEAPLCSEAGRTRVLEKMPTVWLRQVTEDGLDDYCFAGAQGLAFAQLQQTQSALNMPIGVQNPVPKLQQRMRIQTAWLLPFLYGLLGACVYVMRRLLFDTRRAAVENIVILLRLALGALAGVVIGWFASPALASSSMAAGGAASWPYVLAFLAGFSIDNLFNLLDRVNRVVGGKDAKPAAAGG